MTKTYAQIVKQIEVLKQDAEKARRKEVDGVVSRIRDAINVYSLTAEDLGFGSKPKAAGKAPMAPTTPAAPLKKRAAKKAKEAKAPAEVKFKNDTGGTWGGRGKRPDWLRKALSEGKSLADFAVK